MLKVFIDDLITSASRTGIPIPDFENLDFKIARGLMGIQTGNFNKQVITAEGKAQSEKRSLTGRSIAWKIYDFFKISGDNETILRLQRLLKGPIKERTDLQTANWRECTRCKFTSRKTRKTCCNSATRTMIFAD